MKTSERLNKWIKRTVSDGIFENEKEALDVMAELGIELCELFGIDRNAIASEALPLTVEKFDVFALSGKSPITQTGIDNFMIHIIEFGKALNNKSILGQFLAPLEYFEELNKEKKERIKMSEEKQECIGCKKKVVHPARKHPLCLDCLIDTIKGPISLEKWIK